MSQTLVQLLSPSPPSAYTITGGLNLSTNPLSLQGQNVLQFADADSSNYVGFKAPATVASNVTWTLPSTDGTSNQVLKTDGAGTLSWATASSGGDVLLANNNAFTGANTFFNATGQTVSSSSTNDGIILKGNGSGTTGRRVTLQPASLSSSRTLTLPNVSGTVVTTGDTATVTSSMLVSGIIDSLLPSQTGNDGSILVTNGTSSSWGSRLTASGSQTVSGTTSAVSFTGIPSWVKRVTVYFSGLSTNGSTGFVVAQLGTSSGGYETSGYAGVYLRVYDNATPNCGADSSTTGAIVVSAATAAASTYYGMIRFMLLTGNTWVYERITSPASSGGNNQLVTGGGSKVLSGTLDRVQLVATGGDLLDAGTINVVYE